MGFGYRGDVSSRNDIAYTLWEKRYIFRKEMLPIFLNEDFGKKVSTSGDLVMLLTYITDEKLPRFPTSSRSSLPVKASISFDTDAEIPIGTPLKDNLLKSGKVRYVVQSYPFVPVMLTDHASVLTHNDIAGLESTIDLTYKIASKRLLDIFFDQYNLMDHLQAIKRYILLSAGDFAELLHSNLRYVRNPSESLIRLFILEGFYHSGLDWIDRQASFLDTI
jgi:gamma-tubulin complex component 3